MVPLAPSGGAETRAKQCHTYPMTTDNEDVLLLVKMGWVGSDTIEFRFPPHLRDEVEALLNEHDLSHSTVMELSAATEFAIQAVDVARSAGGATAALALASVIKAFLKRHAGKIVKIRDIEIQGYSPKDTARLLQKEIDDMPARDAEWKKKTDEMFKDED
jgi:hypothetical protein